MSKKEALGKGIRALLEGIDNDISPERRQEIKETAAMLGSVNMIAIAAIEANPYQPRTHFDETALSELSQSIASLGVVQPITVRRLNNSKYQLISGERRLRASQLAGLTEIPAYIRTANDQEMLEFALVENIQREDLNAIEVAITYKRLIDECDLTQENLGDRLGKNRTTVTNYLRLLKLPPEIQKGLKDKVISMGQARALVSVADVLLQLDLYKEVVNKGLSTRQTEALVRQVMEHGKKPSTDKTPKRLPLAYQKVQDKLSSALGTRVAMKPKNNGSGEIVIHYFSDDDLNRLLDLLDEA